MASFICLLIIAGLIYCFVNKDNEIVECIVAAIVTIFLLLVALIIAYFPYILIACAVVLLAKGC
jgi:hypothetical protein